MKKDTNSDRLSVIDNYNLYDTHTHRRTPQLYDRPGPGDQVGEQVGKKLENPRNMKKKIDQPSTQEKEKVNQEKPTRK